MTSIVWPTRGGESGDCCRCNYIMRILVPAANMPAGPQQLRFKFAKSDNGIAYAAFGEEDRALPSLRFLLARALSPQGPPGPRSLVSFDRAVRFRLRPLAPGG